MKLLNLLSGNRLSFKSIFLITCICMALLFTISLAGCKKKSASTSPQKATSERKTTTGTMKKVDIPKTDAKDSPSAQVSARPTR